MINPPPISRLKDEDSPRPFWSVMIPTYNARTGYLEEVLRSVLQQDLGPDEMQIEVVDDCSNDNTAFEVAHRIGGGRVTFHRGSENKGLANNWNRCIERARGHWVHILHQDDFVLPGFYNRLLKGAQQSDAGALFCRYAVANSKGHWLHISELHLESAGLLQDWHASITIQQFIQSPAIAVRRMAYEKVGGFLPHLHYVPDWEMWQRIASQFSFWFEPSILACYRGHRDSATWRMRFDAADAREVREMIDLTVAYHNPDRGRVLAKKARSSWADVAVFHARELLVQAGFTPAWRQIVEALRLSHSPRIIGRVFSFFVLSIRIMESRLRRWIRLKFDTAIQR
jgi:glycosyltransferase involved in cell wall biosynthesis